MSGFVRYCLRGGRLLEKRKSDDFKRRLFFGRKAAAHPVRRNPLFPRAIEEYEDNSFKVVLASRKSFMRASIHIRYDAGSDMLKLWYDNEESYYKDTGERYEPAAATPKPSKTRCPNCKGTGSCPKCRGSMWVTEWKYVYVKGSPELTQSTHLCDEKYCYGGSCYMCGGDGWVDD